MAIGWFIVCIVLFIVLLIFGMCKVSGDSADAEAAYFSTVKATPKPTETWIRYPVPLDDNLQKYIQQKCAEKQISPAIVFAIIGVESGYDATVVGDNGNSYGLMQIYHDVHLERMKRLGLYNLLNPYQNVTVGIDILAELIDMGNGIEWALSYYNGNGGNPCDYTKTVMNLAECLLEGVTVVSE